jgi:hypothetical protein
MYLRFGLSGLNALIAVHNVHLVQSLLFLPISAVNTKFAPCSFPVHLVEVETRIVTGLEVDSLFLCTIRGASSLVARHFQVHFKVASCVLAVCLPCPSRVLVNFSAFLVLVAISFAKESGSLCTFRLFCLGMVCFNLLIVQAIDFSQTSFSSLFLLRKDAHANFLL